MPSHIKTLIKTGLYVPGARSHAMRKVPNLKKQIVYKSTLRRLAKRAGIQRVSKDAYKFIRGRLHHFLDRVLSRADHYREYQNLATLTRKHLRLSLAREKLPIHLIY